MLQVDITLLIQMIVFLIAMWVLTKFLFNPILINIKQRNKAIQGTYQEIETREGEFKKRLEEYERRIEEARREISERLLQRRKEIEQEQLSLINRTREEADRLLNQAKLRIQEETEKARQTLRERSILFSTLIVKKLLGRDPVKTSPLKIVPFFFVYFPLLIGLFGAGELLAATPGHHDVHNGGMGAEEYFKLFWHIVNFLLLMIVLYILTRKNITSYFSQRSDRIAEELNEAQRARREMEQKIKEYETRLQSVDEEVARMQQEAERELEYMREKMMEEAKRISEVIMDQTQKTIQLETRKAQEALQADATSLAINMAEDRLRKEITSEDQERLLRNYLEQLGGQS